MEEKTKNGILWTIYSIIIFLVLQNIIDKSITKLLQLRLETTEIQNGIDIGFVLGSIWALIASIVIPLILIFILIHFSDINKINEFLKPNKFKVTIISIIIFLLFAIVILDEAIGIELRPIILDILFIRLIIFGPIVRILFPIVIYYLIVCLIYNISRKSQK